MAFLRSQNARSCPEIGEILGEVRDHDTANKADKVEHRPTTEPVFFTLMTVECGLLKAASYIRLTNNGTYTIPGT